MEESYYRELQYCREYERHENQYYEQLRYNREYENQDMRDKRKQQDNIFQMCVLDHHFLLIETVFQYVVNY